ncbi:MAG: hypothetical protein H6585_11810 [Flavobacteriales bacterium]|nr:hypothetical protein [Flavobacteriales bacterium]MCB9449015.1 hypothetical protein [Flavobacteriales bacterium]
MKSLIVTLVGMVFLLTCNDAPEKPNKNTEVFSNYLRNQFQTELPETPHRYLLLPAIYCKGCVQKYWMDLTQWGETNDHNLITIITTQPKAIPDSISQQFETRVDRSGMLDRLPLRVANLTILKSENRNVYSVFSIPTTDTTYVGKLLE